jgi:hypothetical protein
MLAATRKFLQLKSDRGIFEMFYQELPLNQAVLEDARSLMKAGADVELILLFLRDRGVNQIGSISTLQVLMGMPHAEAKRLICFSEAWSDHFDSVQDLHDKARKALLELAASGDEDLPKIELMGFDEEES